MTPLEAFNGLYYECVPQRPTPPDAQRMERGPTAQWRLLLGERELWELLSLFADEPGVDAA